MINSNNNYLILTRPVLTVISLVLVAIMVVVVMLATTKTVNAQTCYNNSVELEVVTCTTGIATGCWVVPASGPHGTGTPFEIDCTTLLLTSPGWTDTSEIDTGKFCNDVPISIGVECETDVNPIYSYVTAIINFLSAGVGIVVVTMVAVGGVQYMMAGGNPQATQAAIKRISNALIALVIFIFLWAFLSWIVPGGMFNPSSTQTQASQDESLQR